jgi:hypothetical protein
MVQAVNIVTGVIPYREFLADLAGSYRSPDGTDHEAEDDRQAFRRFPFVAEVTPETFEFYANEGFFEGTDEYKAFRHLFTMRCNMRELAQTLDAIETEEGKDQFRDAVGQKVLGGMLSAHRDVRPTGSLAAADAIAILDRVATLTGTEMEDDRARRERNEADARAQAAELDKARWEVRDATPAFHG